MSWQRSMIIYLPRMKKPCFSLDENKNSPHSTRMGAVLCRVDQWITVKQKRSETYVSDLLVEISGIEPLTSWMPFKRSPSWAIPPYLFVERSGRPNELYFSTLKSICQQLFSKKENLIERCQINCAWTAAETVISAVMFSLEEHAQFLWRLLTGGTRNWMSNLSHCHCPHQSPAQLL